VGDPTSVRRGWQRSVVRTANLHFVYSCSQCKYPRMESSVREPSDEQLGLRERKKRATREALKSAALALAAERGLDVTVDEICASADVSARTFFNYFSSKEEAIIGDLPKPPPDDILEVFEGGGPTGDLLDDLRATLRPHLLESVPSLREMHQRKRILEADPGLARQFFASFMMIEQRLTLAAARRSGTRTSDPRAQVVGTIGTVAMRLAVRRWINSGGRASIETHVDAVFDALTDVFVDVETRNARD
jgi:AcrR family transcriptional regulator